MQNKGTFTVAERITMYARSSLKAVTILRVDHNCWSTVTSVYAYRKRGSDTVQIYRQLCMVLFMDNFYIALMLLIFISKLPHINLANEI